MMTLDGAWMDLAVSDGTRMRAWVARPEGRDRAPGLLVYQEVFGVNDHIQEVCERFAAEGFVALAPEVYHRTAPGQTFAYDDIEHAREHKNALTLNGLEADARAVMDWFRGDRQTAGVAVGAIGYCMGGRLSFLAHTTLPLACAVSYYGGDIHTHLDRIPLLHGPHLFCWGGLDKTITNDQRPLVVEGLKAAGKPYVDLVISDAHHGFACDMRPKVYSGAATRQARGLTLAFLHEHLG